MRNTMPIPSGISLPPSFFLPGRRSAGLRIARFAARLAGVGLLMQVAGCTGLVPGLPG